MITDLSVLKFIIGFFIVFKVLNGFFFSGYFVSFNNGSVVCKCYRLTSHNQQLDMLAVSIGPGKFTPL